MDRKTSTVLPPFTGKLRADYKLKLSHPYFTNSIRLFHANKQLPAIDQLRASPPYPTPHVLAQFADMTYCDYKHAKPKSPDGWQLLTTASNSGSTNGYFGTAYWHPAHQQVVIAHRGTDIKDIGSLLTDVKSVLFNECVQQMGSASTFANTVVIVLQEIEQEKNVSFELFFTGHSTGGWLAQITAFTTEFLEVNGGTFLKKSERQETDDVRQSYHPHTVVFNSPGCKDMLSQMSDRLDVRQHGISIDLRRLDINNYMSAPNRINTCDSHLGTVYRIFTDLSDMGWLEQHTTLYNQATHRMDKIVQAFDPETGQVRKDDKGRLKILEVVDWPVSEGLTGGAEWIEFFKRAKHHNNYHPEEMDISYSLVHKGYHKLHYQTKDYEECTSYLCIFTQDQQEFLKHYHSLRVMPELFKPMELFSVMNNVEAQNEAEQKLRFFEFDDERIRCPDARTLHALIPYVKRLVRIFPHIMEKLKDQMSPSRMRNNLYQNETEHYVRKIHNSLLDFNPDTLSLREFLESDQQVWQLRMIDGDAWRGITKVYRVLQKTFCPPNYFREDHYAILELERLLTVSRNINLKELLVSMEAPHLLMIACGTSQPFNDEVENMLRELFNILKQKNTMKIILTTQTESDIADFIKELAIEIIGEGFIIVTDEKLIWSDLTASSQTAILEKTVTFQGRRIALNQLTSAESMTASLPLADLLEGKELTIGEEYVPSACSGYNEKYYIDRTFNHNIVIRQDILNDKGENKFTDLLANTEQEYIQLCELNPRSKVHWLVEEKSGELVWHQSQGDIKTLHEYINAHRSKSYAPSDLDNLLQQALNQRVMIIADTAGMGKTTLLTHLSKCIKQKYPANWLVRIDLNDYTELLKAQLGKKMDEGRVLEIVSKEVLKLESNLETELFKKAFEGNGVSKVVVMVDCFDEICPDYKETVIDMLQVLKQTPLEQLWVTTRSHLKEELEDNLQQLSYTLQPFSQVEQVKFLKKYWTENLNLEITDQHRLETYAAGLIRKMAQSIIGKDRNFTGIPLQTHMIAEAFEEDFKLFYESEESEPDLAQKLNLLGLYGRFIDVKYDIYYGEKWKISAGYLFAEDIRKRLFKDMQLEHQHLALQALFTADKVTFLENYHSAFSDEELASIGIVQRNRQGKPHFVDSNFADYFVAEFLINQLTKETNPHPHVQDILLNEVLTRRDYQVTRSFLDGFFEKSRPSKKASKHCGELLNKQWKERETCGTFIGVTTALHQAAAEDNACTIGFLMNNLKSAERLSTLKEIMLDVDDKGCPVWYMAAQEGSLQALKKIWEWVEEFTR